MDPRLIVLALGAFAGTMESSVVPALLPGIGHETGASAAATGYVVFGYSLAYAIAAPILATLLGASDRRRVIAGAELTLAICALLIAFAPTLPLIIAARSLLACAAVLFTSMAQATVVAISPPERRGRALSVVLTGGTLAVAAGAPLGALIAIQFGWRWSYGVVAALACFAAVALWFGLPHGIVGEHKKLRERLAVLAIPGIPSTLAASTVFMVGAYVATVYLAAITTQSLGLAQQTLPLAILANGLGSVLGSVTGGHSSDRLGPRRTVLLLMFLTALGLAAISALPLLPPAAILPAWLLIVAILGLTGWAVYAGQISLLAVLAPGAVPLAVSLYLSASNIGIAVGAATGSFVLAHFGAGLIGLAAGGFCLAGAVLLMLNRRVAAIAG